MGVHLSRPSEEPEGKRKEFPGSDRALDPQIRRILEAAYHPEALPLTSRTPQEIRAAALPGLPAKLAPIADTRDVFAQGPDGPLPLRIYTPDSLLDEGAILFFHGGGFVFGSINSHENIARLIAMAAKRTVISAGYRLAPEHQFPAAVDDAYAALTWVADRGKEIGIGAGSIVVAGDSAGGNLAAAISYSARERNGPKISAQILMCPVLSMDMNTPSALAAEDGPGGTRAEMIWWRDYYLRSEADIENPLASPAFIPDMAGLPPTLIILAEFDPLNDGSRRYAERLSASGTPVTLRQYPGTVHSFYGNWSTVDISKRVFEEIGRFCWALPP